MKKLKLIFTYITALLVHPKKAAEAVNEAESAEELDERIKEL